jgi:tetraacyldisaccharide 4'-kinase
LKLLSSLYAALVRRRREWYSARPDLRRRLRHPVISVGNLAVGGRGKTPIVASIARLLCELDERPAILSRGYGRESASDGVVIVRDAHDMRADLARSGDEPLMLARQLPGVRVLVSSDRFLAGCVAEHHLGATVHLLDDGFQHLQLDRDVDIVIVAGADVAANALTLPSGDLREPPDTLIAADAVLALDGRIACDTSDTPTCFRVQRMLGPPTGDRIPAPPSRVLALAGIARPQAFFDDLRSRSYEVARTLVFRDHHPYSTRDAGRIWSAAEAAGAASVLTTEKDYVRLLPHRPFPLPLAYLPLTMEPEPLPEFRHWLAASLRAARDIV